MIACLHASLTPSVLVLVAIVSVVLGLAAFRWLNPET